MADDEWTFRCNVLECRQPLTDQAIVTTCSHIYCVRCADIQGLTRPSAAIKTCPACGEELPNRNDIALQSLEPTEDYKANVLSGLKPTDIAECAAKALGFYNYQANQEILYQQYLADKLGDTAAQEKEESRAGLEKAQAECQKLQETCQRLRYSLDQAQKKNEALENALKEECSQLKASKANYRQLKQNAEMGPRLADAPEMEAQATLGRAHAAQPRPERNSHERRIQSGYPVFGSHVRGHMNITIGSTGPQYQANQAWNQQNIPIRGYTAQNASVAATPAHRQRMPAVAPQYSRHDPRVSCLPNQAGPYQRQPLGIVNPNILQTPSTSTYGMRAGMKMGRQPAPSRAVHRMVHHMGPTGY